MLFLHLLVCCVGGSLHCFATSSFCCWNYCCWFIALLVLMLLFRCIVGLVVVCLLHYWPWCWFIMLLMQLVHRVTNIASSSCYYSCYWFPNTIRIPLLFLYIVLLCCWLLFMLHVFWWEYYPHHHWHGSSKLVVSCIVVCLPLEATH